MEHYRIKQDFNQFCQAFIEAIFEVNWDYEESKKKLMLLSIAQ